VIGLLYLLGAGFVFAYDTRPRGFLIVPAQLIGTAVVAAALVVAALALPRRTAGGASSKGAPRPWLAGVAALALTAVPNQAPASWGGVAVSMAAGPAGSAPVGVVEAVGLGARAGAGGRRRSPGGHLLLRR
jgi:hypothetical protein